MANLLLALTTSWHNNNTNRVSYKARNYTMYIKVLIKYTEYCLGSNIDCQLLVLQEGEIRHIPVL